MESAKIPHHHHHRHHHHHPQVQLLPLHQDQLFGSSTNLQYSPAYAAPSPHVWTSNNSILNSTNNNGSFDPSAINGASILQYSRNLLVPSLSEGSITNQDLSFNWLLANGGSSGIKQQMISNNSCPNLSEMISSSSPSSSIEDVQSSSYGKEDPNVKLLLSTLSSSSSSSGAAHHRFQSCSPEELMYSAPKRVSFSQIYPTINISNLSHHATALAGGSFDAGLRPLDLLDLPARSLQDHHHHQVGINLSEDIAHTPDYGYDYVKKQSIQQPLEPSNNKACFSNGVGEEKSSTINESEVKAPQQQATKRARLESNRPSCPPFKVRKEKLGDRIAALQQLVAPFGKTDTASVLMEAIGYIKFLQNQVETLSVPYLKQSRNKTRRAIHGVLEEVDGGGREERRRDLKSRGLCLVPMSCLSYMTDIGGSVWPPPPSFGGGT